MRDSSVLMKQHAQITSCLSAGLHNVHVQATILIPMEHGHVAGKPLNDITRGRKVVHTTVQGWDKRFHKGFVRVSKSNPSVPHILHHWGQYYNNYL